MLYITENKIKNLNMQKMHFSRTRKKRPDLLRCRPWKKHFLKLLVSSFGIPMARNYVFPYLGKAGNKREPIILLNTSCFSITMNMLRYSIFYRYTILSCISGIDYVRSKYRFVVAYELLSMRRKSRLRVLVLFQEGSTIPSIVDLYSGANWWERETWDMFGIYFSNHPNLRRILTDYGFEGYPLRKDFPLSGYLECRYDFNKQRISLEDLELSQEHRYFTSDLTWMDIKF